MRAHVSLPTVLLFMQAPRTPAEYRSEAARLRRIAQMSASLTIRDRLLSLAAKYGGLAASAKRPERDRTDKK
jgi:uncharacterized protein YceH (UPF0502 family)